MFNQKTIDSVVILVPIWLNRVKGVLFLPFLVRAIGLDGYGAYIQIMANVAILTPFVHFALGQPILRFNSSDSDSRVQAKALWTALWFCIFSSIILIAISVSLSSYLSAIFLQGNYKNAIIISFFLLLPNGFALIFVPYLNSRRRYKEASMFWFVREFLPYLILTVVIWYSKDLTLGIACSIIMSYIISFSMLTRIALNTGITGFSWKLLQKYILFSWPIALSSFARVATEAVPRYLIPAFLGSAVLGMFNIIYMVIRMLGALAEPFLRYLNSTMPRLWDSGEKSKLQDTIERSTVIFLVMTIAGLLVLLEILAPIAAHFINNEKLHSLDGLENNLLILGLFAVFYGLNDFSIVYAKLFMKTRIILFVSLAALLAALVSTAILMPIMGLVSASIGQLLGVLIAHQLYSYKLNIVRSNDYSKKLIRLFLVSLIALALWLLMHYGLAAEWYVTLPILAATYLILVDVMRVVTISDIKTLVLKRA